MNFGNFLKYMSGCAFIFCYMNLFWEKDITSKEHMLEINLQKKSCLTHFKPVLHFLYPWLWLSDVLVGIETEQWMKSVKMFL